MHNFRKLKIWQESLDFTKDIYMLTKSFPSEEKFGLKSQLRRCAVSIPSNIAEGAGRNSENEFIHFLGIATGSSYELETQLVLSIILELSSEEHTNELIVKLHGIQKRIFNFKQSLKKT